MVLFLRLGRSAGGDDVGKVEVVERSPILPFVATELTSVRAGRARAVATGSHTTEMFDDVRRLNLLLS